MYSTMTAAKFIASGRFHVLMSSARTAYVSIGIAPGCTDGSRGSISGPGTEAVVKAGILAR